LGRTKKFKFLLILFVLFLLSPGCRALKPPSPGGEPMISLYVNQTGEIKKLGLEEYVAGVVAAEMDPIGL